MLQQPIRPDALARPQLAGPLYFQIQHLLRSRILAKEWGEGQPLPNETDLARAYGVSVGTMRKALDLLAQSKVIVRRQGLGTFVNARREEPPSRFRRWVSGADQLAETAHHVLHKNFGQPTAVEAQKLRLPASAPVARVAVETAVGGIKLALDEYVIPVADSVGLDDFMIDGSNFSSYLQQLESTVARCDDRIRVDLAATAEWPVLGLRAATPVLRLERQAFSRSDRPLFLCNRCILPSATTQYQVVIE